MHFHERTARILSPTLIFSFIFGFFAILVAPHARAQNRVNDRDMEALMRNLRDDAKSFRPHFDTAVHKSTIRKTSQEREARDTADAFQRDTETLLNRFKKDHNGQQEFANVLASAKDIDRSVNSLSLGPQVASDWDRIRTELRRIASAYGIEDPFQQSDLTPMENNGASCLQTDGETKAGQLVSECQQVSPATHPPCNVQNSCALIINEIKRSCALIGINAPRFCNDYR